MASRTISPVAMIVMSLPLLARWALPISNFSSAGYRTALFLPGSMRMAIGPGILTLLRMICLSWLGSAGAQTVMLTSDENSAISSIA